MQARANVEQGKPALQAPTRESKLNPYYGISAPFSAIMSALTKQGGIILPRSKTKTRSQITREYEAKTYDFKRLRIRKDWLFDESVKQAAIIANEPVNTFMVHAIVERARALGVPFENGPFFDTEPAEADEQPDADNNE